MLRTTVGTAAPLLTVLALGASPAAAQQASGTAWSDLRVEQPAGALPVYIAPFSASATVTVPTSFPVTPAVAPVQAHAQTWHASLGRRVLHVIGGAVVGSGVGYFASQVKYSDWDKQSNSEFSSQRALFTGGGAGVGALLGLVLGSRPAGDAGLPVTPALPGMADAGTRSAAPVATSRNAPLGPEEIQRARASNAYEIVQSLRPLWLEERGRNSYAETARVGSYDKMGAAVIPGEATIKVYLDGAQVGGVNALRQVPASTVRSIEYLDPAAAALRFGQGVTHGAILVSTSAS